MHNSLTARAEKKLLCWLCARMPIWVTPNMLTLLGLVGACFAFCGYWLSCCNLNWLWLSIVGIALNWFGDSLDGSLARHRQIERPKFGFFVDHITDTFAMALVGIGIGLSPFLHLLTGITALLGYYFLMILSLTTCVATQVFRISFNGVGPTEIRLFIIGCTLAALLMPVPVLRWIGLEFTIYDAFVMVLASAMFVRGALQAVQTGRELSALDPRVHNK